MMVCYIFIAYCEMGWIVVQAAQGRLKSLVFLTPSLAQGFVARPYSYFLLHTVYYIKMCPSTAPDIGKVQELRGRFLS